MNTAISTALISLSDFVIPFLSAQAPYGWEWRMHPMFAWGWGVVMMAMMLLFAGVVIFAGTMALRWFFDQTGKSHDESALEILKKRFARGEIEKDEFDTKKQQLS